MHPRFTVWLAPVVFALFFLVFLYLRSHLWRALRSKSKGSSSDWGDNLAHSLKKPVTLFCLYFAVLAGIQFLPTEILEYPQVKHWLSPLSKIGVILFSIWIVDRMVSVGLLHLPFLDTITSSTRSLLKKIIRVILLILGTLIVLDTLGIAITPILASLGVGSLAVALALQDTLSNFFSGLYLLIDKPIRVGDYVQVQPGLEGYVRKIGWRSTHVEQLSNNTVVIPNSKLSSSNLLNYDYPQQEAAVLVPLGVSYNSDLEKVERVTIETAKEVLKRVPGTVADFEPFIRYGEFADSSINFNVILRAKAYTDNFLLKHEFIKAIHSSYKKEGIEIPFPQRVVQLLRDGEK